MASILIVDDDQTLLKLLGMRLTLEGHEVTSAISGEQALAKVTIRRPDVVITDLRMNGMDGLALFDAVYRLWPGLPVIILTAHGTIPDAVIATQRGVFGYLPKPFEAKALMHEVGRALESGGSSDSSNTAWRQGIVSRSSAMDRVLEEALGVARSVAPILIVGETGTGKELLARAIHEASDRREAPFLAVNCGAIPEQLLETELFGHTKGAFTGAVKDKVGLFRAADGGTIFLDEIGDMPLPLQVKLLRVLQEREVRQLGATQSQRIDVRTVSATHRNLKAEVVSRQFREDLYYRINVVGIHIPPLRERPEDIPLLANSFLAETAQRYGKQVLAFAPEAMEKLLSAAWPGNVRQLQNVVEKCVALSKATLVPASLLERAIESAPEDFASFDAARREFERTYLARVLRATAGNVSQAARLAQRNRSDFYSLLARHALDPSDFKAH